MSNVVVALRQWAVDAQTVVNGWSGTSYSATKDAQLKETIRRFGILCTRLANVVEGDDIDE